MNRKVTVRAYGGDLALLVAVDESEKLTYVANPLSAERIASGQTEPVGVPKEDVVEGWPKEAAN